MIHEKKVSVGAGYANKAPYEFEGKKYEADIKDGDLVKILDEGQEVQKTFQGKTSTAVVHKIETRNGTKAITLNQTSINNLVDAFGKDSKEWIGKQVKVWILKVMVSGKLQNVAYLSHPKAEMNDEGKFLTPETGNVKIEKEEDEDINFDEEEYPEASEVDSPFKNKKK